VQHLLKRSDVEVKAFVRASTNQKPLIAQGVSCVVGDLTDKDSVAKAFDPSSHGGKKVSYVIYTAATYMGRQSGDSQQQDLVAFQNVVAGVKQHSVKRLVFASIVNAKAAVNVPHFYDKHLCEEHARKEGIQYIAVSAPMFLDQAPSNDMNPRMLKKNVYMVMSDPTAITNIVLTDDFARALVIAALDIPDADANTNIPIASEGNCTLNDIAAEFTQILKRKVVCKPPFPGASYALGLVGKFSEFVHDLNLMFQFFSSGKYLIEDWSLTKKYFGRLRSLQNTVETYVNDMKARGNDLSENPPSWTSRLASLVVVGGASYFAYSYFNSPGKA